MSYTGLVERAVPLDEIDIYRIMKSAGRKRSDMARAVADAIEALTRPVDVEAVARAIAAARCDAGRPDPGKGLDEFIAQAALAAMETPHADG